MSFYRQRWIKLYSITFIISIFFCWILLARLLYDPKSDALPALPNRYINKNILPNFGGFGDKKYEDFIKQIYSPHIPSLTNDWTDERGETWIMKQTIHKKPLGSDVLIIDVDNRIGNGKDVKLGESAALRIDKLDYISAGILNHKLYATIHGYDYQLYKPTYNVTLHPTWFKVAGIAEALKTHKFVVFLDGDAIFRYMELPLEWLMNYWNVDDKAIVTAAYVPHKGQADRKWDRLHKYPKMNTGFLIMQNLPNSNKTDELMSAWLDCPKGKRYPGCEEFRVNFPHEQAGLASYIRLDDEFRDHINPVPCMEANGSPIHKMYCKGKLVEHMWGRKEQVMHQVMRNAARPMFKSVYKSMWDNKDRVMPTLDEAPEQWEEWVNSEKQK